MNILIIRLIALILDKQVFRVCHVKLLAFQTARYSTDYNTSEHDIYKELIFSQSLKHTRRQD